MLNNKNIVFVIVIFSTLIAWSAEVLGIYKLNSVPDIITLVVFLLLFVTDKISIPVRMIYAIIPIVLIFSIVVFYNLLNVRSLTGGSGIIGLTLITIIFVCFLNADKSTGQVYLLWRQISILYVIHIGYIFFETILLMATDYSFMKSLIPSYRNLTGQPIYMLLNMHVSGANGLMVGPQVASQMLALSLIWFAPIYKKNNFTIKYFPNKLLWLVSLILYPFCMTGTSLVMLFVMILSILFIYPKRLLKNGIYYIKPFIIISVVVGLFSGTIFDILTYRAPTQKLFAFYLEVFLEPVTAFFNLPTENILFGMQGNTELLKYSDFGMGAIIWMGGALLATTVIITFIAILIKTIFVINNKKFTESSSSSWIFLAATCAISSVGWLVSLMHYTVAVETGGKQLFAFTVATTIISLLRLKSIQGNKSINLADN